MRNITEQQKAEAKAYNDTIKNSMSIENKLELLYLDLIDYVEAQIGEKTMKYIKMIVNTFKEYEKNESIEIILRELKRRKKYEMSGMFLNSFHIEFLKMAVDMVLNADDKEALLDRIKVKLYEIGKGNMDARVVLNAVLNDKFNKTHEGQIIGIIARAICKKYYKYFYRNLNTTLSKIIDNYSENGESLEPKVKELIAKKEAKA